MIRRRGQRPEEEASSSEEEDAFTALSKTTAKRQRTESQGGSSSQEVKPNDASSKSLGASQKTMVLPKAITSSMKRHHKPNDDRRAKMDALLQELEAEKQKVSKGPHRFVPDKKGSFVDPSEEHLTTNIFVGNLAPSITEEDLTELFLQFGELYSIKIMWPRTSAERSRKRNTGFVCFMNREDAEEAMEACNEADPFNVGRLLMMRWGKNVKRNVLQGTGGGINIQPLLSREIEAPADVIEQDPNEICLRGDGLPSTIEFKGPDVPVDRSLAMQFQPGIHLPSAVTVTAPLDPERFRFISVVASFVAIDGSQMERKLIEAEGNNPEFTFLELDGCTTETLRNEHIFYRWRVYSFCQGDTYSNWRTQPFVMFHPNGRFWIPPPLDRAASSLEKEKSEEKNETIRREKDKRAEMAQERKEFSTGRQIERSRMNRRKGNRRNMNWEVRTKLSPEDRDRFNWLVRRKLTISRESICSAMAFCFEKTGAAEEISALLKDALEDNSPHVTIDMRIARLYLLSDILFNSQQPGVRNAFMYRDALEKMAPDIFASLGQHGSGRIGRMTMNKLRNAVSTVLGAWTEWSVYNPTFLGELEARFYGREIPTESAEIKPSVAAVTAASDTEKFKDEDEVVITQARGDWIEVAPEEDDGDREDFCTARQNAPSSSWKGEPVNKAQLPTDHEVVQNASCQGELDGAATDVMEGNSAMRQGEDLDRPIGHDAYIITMNTDGIPTNDDIDGMPLEDESIDGVPAESQSDDVDGEILEDIDGEPVDDEAIDGTPLDAQASDIDGEALDGSDLDGEPIDDEGIVGMPSVRQSTDIDDALGASDIDGAEDLDGESLEDGEHLR